MMYLLEYFTYHLRPHKKDENLYFTGKLVNSSDWDFTKVIKKPPINNGGLQGMDKYCESVFTRKLRYNRHKLYMLMFY